MDAEASDLTFFDRFISVDFVPGKWVERIAPVTEADGDLVPFAQELDEAAFFPSLNTTVFDHIGDEFLENDFKVENLLHRGSLVLAIRGQERMESRHFTEVGF